MESFVEVEHLLVEQLQYELEVRGLVEGTLTKREMTKVLRQALKEED